MKLSIENRCACVICMLFANIRCLISITKWHSITSATTVLCLIFYIYIFSLFLLACSVERMNLLIQNLKRTRNREIIQIIYYFCVCGEIIEHIARTSMSFVVVVTYTEKYYCIHNAIHAQLFLCTMCILIYISVR